MHDLILETIGLSKRFGKQLAVDEVSCKSSEIAFTDFPNGAEKRRRLK